VFQFVKEAKAELQKVVWPQTKPLFSPKTELWGAAYVTIALTFILAGFIGVIDFIVTFVGAVGARLLGV